MIYRATAPLRGHERNPIVTSTGNGATPLGGNGRSVSTQLNQFSVPAARSVMGQEEAFPQPRLSGRCRFRKQSVRIFE